MKFFRFAIEACVTGIKRYDYAYEEGDTAKQLKLKRDVKNKYDKNAIQVHLDGEQIGFIKKEEASLLSPVLKTNAFYVKRWGVVSHTDGYMVIQCDLREKE